MLLERLDQHGLLHVGDLELTRHDGEHEAHAVVELGPLLGEHLRQVHLALLVEGEPQRVKVAQDVLGRLVLDDAAALVEERHVGRRERRRELELLVHLVLSLQLLQRRRVLEADGEGDRRVGVVLAHVAQELGRRGALLVVAGRGAAQQGLQGRVLVVLRPLLDRQLRDVQGGRVELADGAKGREARVARIRGHDGAREAAVPRRHRLGLLALHHALQVVHDLARVVVGHAGRPARADAVGAVDQHHRQHGHVILAGGRKQRRDGVGRRVGEGASAAHTHTVPRHTHTHTGGKGAGAWPQGGPLPSIP